MAKDQQPLLARDLLAAVGDVMLRWGFLESAMLEKLEGPVRSPSILQRWLTSSPADKRAKGITELAAIRHLLAHGLCGVCAQPAGGVGAYVMCRDPDGELVRITLAELHDAAQRLDRLRIAVAPR